MSVRSLTASMSSCRIRATPLLSRYRSQPRGRKSRSYVRRAYRSVMPAMWSATRVGQVARRTLVLRRELVGMLQVVLEEVPEQLDGLVVILVRAFPEVHLREHEVAEVVQRRNTGEDNRMSGFPSLCSTRSLTSVLIRAECVRPRTSSGRAGSSSGRRTPARMASSTSWFT